MTIEKKCEKKNKAKTGKSTIKALAIGGNLLEGSTLTIEP